MKGGDFLWRWGNPENYGQGSSVDQKLFGQHDPKWILAGYPNEGKLSVFNNGTGRTPQYSSIEIIDTEIDIANQYTISGSYLPTDVYWSWSGSVLGETVFSNSQSGVNIQPNGNILFCETVPGRISEINISGNVVWSYENPIGNSGVYNQGDIIPNSANQVFRAEKYPVNYIGFSGKDLTSTGILENINSVSDNCNLLSVSDHIIANNDVVIYPNPAVEYFDVASKENIQSILIYNISGKLVKKCNVELDRYLVQDLPLGLYFLKITSDKGVAYKKLIKE
jgi:hypothetical protein